MPADSPVTAQYSRAGFGCDAVSFSIPLSLVTLGRYTPICQRHCGRRVLDSYRSLEKIILKGHALPNSNSIPIINNAPLLIIYCNNRRADHPQNSGEWGLMLTRCRSTIFNILYIPAGGPSTVLYIMPADHILIYPLHLNYVLLR